MSRYIDANKLKKSLSIPCASIIEIGETIIAQIDDQPTADVVEVVRCKDCIYKEECGREVLVNEYDNDKAVDITGFLFYCSYGERRAK